MPACITRTEASDVTDLESEYPYMYWIPDEQLLVVSKKQLSGRTIDSGNGVLIRNIENNTWIQTETFDYYILEISDYKLGDCYRLYYNDVTGWEAKQPDEVKKELTTTTIYKAAYGSSTLSKSIYTNGIALPSPWASAGSSLPSGLPPLDLVDDAINVALNNTTWVSGEANAMIDNLQKQQEKYENGQLSKEQFTILLEVYNQTFIDMADSPSNTLADQIAINNGLTAVQTAQDKMISDDTIEAITSILDAYNIQHTITQQENGFTPEMLTYIITECVNGLTTQYFLGNISKNDAVKPFVQMIATLTPMVANPEFTEADKYVLSELIDFANQQIDTINGAGDINSEIADDVDSSNEAEKEYLDSLTSETTASIQDISPKDSFSDAEMGTAQEVLSIIWENKLVKRLLVICGCFMVVCVVLGIRYKV